MTKLKQIELEAIFVKSINDYSAQTRFEPVTFMLHFRELQEKDPKELEEDYEICVQNLGGGKYAAEYWEEGVAVNSEKHAMVCAQELANRKELAKISPDIEGIINEVKKTHKDIRNSINTRKQERYTKMMALLYVQEKDGSITFRNSYRPVIDSIK